MYYVMRASAPSLHRESTDSLIFIVFSPCLESPDDYLGGGKSIQFKTGDTNQTYHITIKQDQLCEMEFFYVNIDLNSDVKPFDVNVSQAKVFINDSNKPECGKCHDYCNIPSELKHRIMILISKKHISMVGKK